MITQCDFTQNYATLGAGIGCNFGSNADVVVTDCSFEIAQAENGGAIHSVDAIMLIERCRFDFCISSAGAVATVGNSPDVVFRDCTFINSFGTHGTLTVVSADVLVDGCTFWGNSAQYGACVKAEFGANVTIVNSILACSTNGAAAVCWSNGVIDLQCSDVYGNAGGDWVDCIAGQAGLNGNFAADPMFCDAAAEDFTLAESSPCLPGNHPTGEPCGLIGAYPQGCGPTVIEASSWGAIKATYRR